MSEGIVVIDNLEYFLREAPQKIANALEMCGGVMETYAKEECPVDTGTLRNSIAHLVDTEQNTVYVGTDVYYGIYLEYGTGIHATEGQGRMTPWVYQDRNGEWHRTDGIEPRPFIKPSVAEHIDEYQKMVEEYLKE